MNTLSASAPAHSPALGPSPEKWHLVLSPPENTFKSLQKKLSPQSALPLKKCALPKVLSPEKVLSPTIF